MIASDDELATTAGPIWVFSTPPVSLTLGLYSYFPMDDKNDALGYAATGESGTLSYTPGLLGDSLTIPANADNTMIYMGDSISDREHTYRDFMYGDATLNVWINIASFDAGNMDGVMTIVSGFPILDEHEGGCIDGIEHWALWIRNVPSRPSGASVPSGSEVVALRAASFDAAGVHDPASAVSLEGYEGLLAVDTWTVITIRHDADSHTWQLSINGQIEDSVTMPAGIGPGALTRDCPYAIGDRPITLPHGYPFSGRIDELAFWDRTLSDAEVQVLYNQGLGVCPMTLAPLFSREGDPAE